MKFITAASALAVSAFSLASSVANGEHSVAVHANGSTSKATVSAALLERLLFSMDDVDTVEEFKAVCGVSDERLHQLRQLRKYLVEYVFEGDVGEYKTFKERAVNIAFLMSGKDKDTEELDATDFIQLVQASGVSGLTFDEVLECIGNGEGLSYEEVLYIFCLGDPHFATWQGAHFDYHGACDLVLVNNESFDNHNGLDLHVRLEQLMPEGQYSLVSDAALRIGNDVLEVSKDGSYSFNGQKDAAFPLTVGGFPATRTVKANCIQNAENGEAAKSCTEMLTFDVTVGEKEHIQMKVAKDMVHVSMEGRTKKFEGSVGVMGTYPHSGHGRVARDGQTVIQDVDAFSQEWQVRDTDSKLFQQASGPQFPTQCTPPSEAHASNQRRLRQGSADEKALQNLARVACEHLASDHMMQKNCIFDVMATGDAEMATMVYGGVW